MANRIQHFHAGSSTYRCCVCNKMTRDTGIGEREAEMCAKDYLLTNADNMLSDGVYTQEEYDLKVKCINDGTITDCSSL
jgi:hypothetical protein